MTRNKTGVTAQSNNGHVVTSNVLHFKMIPDEDSDDYETVDCDILMIILIKIFFYENQPEAEDNLYGQNVPSNNIP